MIDWNFDLLESLIQDRGDDVIWETGFSCPNCRRSDTVTSLNQTSPTEATRLRKINCQVCDGYGYVYRNPIVVKGLITQVLPGNRQLIDIGIAFPGDSVFSPSLTGPELHDFDKVTMMVPMAFHEGQVLQRNGAHLDEAALMNLNLETNEDRLWYFGTGDVMWCEDENNTAYEAGTDFQIEGNKLIWTGNRPNDGVFYTVKYYYYPEWIVFASPMVRVDRGRNLQQRVLLRKKHTTNLHKADQATPGDRQELQSSLTGIIKI